MSRTRRSRAREPTVLNVIGGTFRCIRKPYQSDRGRSMTKSGVSGWRLPPTILVFGSLVGPLPASAAPFCIANLSLPPQCMYYDAALCQKDAGKQGGWCTPNPAETHAASGSGKYCVAFSQGVALCIYQSRESCDEAAARQGGACYFDPQRASGGPDPFSQSSGPGAGP